MKKILLFLLCLITGLGMSGCKSKYKFPSNEEMVRHIEEKYKEDFEYYGPAGGTITAESKEILCSSPSYPDYLTWVYYEPGTDTYKDDVIPMKFNKRTNEKMDEIAEKALPDNKYARVFYDGGGLSKPEWNSETTFEEYYTSLKARISFMVIVEADGEYQNFDQIIENIKSAILDSGMYIKFIRVKFVSPENFNYEKVIDKKEYSAIKGEDCIRFTRFEMDDLTTFTEERL